MGPLGLRLRPHDFSISGTFVLYDCDSPQLLHSKSRGYESTPQKCYQSLQAAGKEDQKFISPSNCKTQVKNFIKTARDIYNV